MRSSQKHDTECVTTDRTVSIARFMGNNEGFLQDDPAQTMTNEYQGSLFRPGKLSPLGYQPF